MKTSRVRLLAGMLAVALNVSFLAGCASNRERQTGTMSPEAFRFLYPREYNQSLSPWQQEDVEREMMEQEWDAGGKR